MLWLWCRPEAAAPIGPLAYEPPYATGAALKKKWTKDQKNNKNNKIKYNVKLTTIIVKVYFLLPIFFRSLWVIAFEYSG